MKKLKIQEKSSRYNELDNIKEKIKKEYGDEINLNLFSDVFKRVEADVVRTSILKTKKRLNEIEELVEKLNKRELRYYMVERDQQDLTKDSFLSQQYLMM